MELRSIGVGSAAKIGGTVYAGFGLVIGVVVSAISVLGATVGAGGGGLLRMLLGAGAVIALPLFYGVIGVVSGAIGAALYNFAAIAVGGIELDIAGLGKDRYPEA